MLSFFVKQIIEHPRTNWGGAHQVPEAPDQEGSKVPDKGPTFFKTYKATCSK